MTAALASAPMQSDPAGELRGAGERPFIPPAFHPLPARVGFLAALRSIRTVVDGWPAAVFEGGVHQLGLPGAPVIVSDPDLAAEVLLERREDFPRGERLNRLFRPVWGRGIFVTEGAEWRWQRRAGAPAFRPAHMAALVPVMRTAAERTLEGRRDGQPFDLQGEMRRLTLNVLFDAALSGGDDFPDKAEASRQIDAFVSSVGKFGLTDLMPMPESWRPSVESRGGKPAAYMREHVGAMVARRRNEAGRAENVARGDLVDLLMAAIDPETGAQMDDVLVRDNLIGFIAAGHETSAYALSWALWLVANHPPTERRLLEEIAAVAGDAPIAAAHLDALVFTRQVVEETLRLYPGAVGIAREAGRDTSIGGRAVRRGTMVLVATYALHRRADFWENPNAFDPDRFAPGGPPRGPFTYLPFGAGPRVCMGAAFAMTELVTALATLVRGAKLAADPARPVEIGVRLGALVAKGGMWMTAAPR